MDYHQSQELPKFTPVFSSAGASSYNGSVAINMPKSSGSLPQQQQRSAGVVYTIMLCVDGVPKSLDIYSVDGTVY